MSLVDERVNRDFGFKGFFQLRVPQDLFAKMRYDYERMRREPLNAYPAFDFFVTANHLVDWIWPSSGRKQQKLDRAADAIARICEHLADGAKHFILTTPHCGVAHVDHCDGPFDPEILDPETFDTEGRLLIELESTEAAELGARTMTAIEFAGKVLDYWTRRGVSA